MNKPVCTVYQAKNAADFSLPNIGPLALVNRPHPLQSGFSITLAPPVEACPDILLERQAAAMLAACLRAVGAAGASCLCPAGAATPNSRRSGRTPCAGRAPLSPRSMSPCRGCSEHETGLAIDLAEKADEIDFIRPAFPYDGVCGAFRRAAARYGFIERYREGKTSLTGIAAEPWHFRYVGAPHAQLMEQRGLCLEEYIALLGEAPLACTLENGRMVTVRRFAAGQPLPPAQGLRQLSGDNAGGVIVTEWGAL